MEHQAEYRSLSSIEELIREIKIREPRQERMLIGIDGMDGVGKTTLAKQLKGALGATLVSLDEYLDRKKGAFARHIRCDDVNAILAARRQWAIVEGVCLREVAARCDFACDVHLYVRRISQSTGIWHDDDIALTLQSVEGLKKRDRELRQLAVMMDESEESQSDTRFADDTGLRGELIDYHAKWDPVRSADLIFDVSREG
jgi:hypothetical protein